jgi:hypothetical protein
VREIPISLSREDLELLGQGGPLGFDEQGYIITLRADSSAVTAFQQHVQAAILKLLEPVNPIKH